MKTKLGCNEFVDEVMDRDDKRGRRLTIMSGVSNNIDYDLST